MGTKRRRSLHNGASPTSDAPICVNFLGSSEGIMKPITRLRSNCQDKCVVWSKQFSKSIFNRRVVYRPAYCYGNKVR